MAEALAPLLSAATSADQHEAVVRAQGLDMLVQHLDTLAAMTARVADGESPRKAVVAAPLGGLVERMCAALDGQDDSQPSQAAPSGDLMLFD